MDSNSDYLEANGRYTTVAFICEYVVLDCPVGISSQLRTTDYHILKSQAKFP